MIGTLTHWKHTLKNSQGGGVKEFFALLMCINSPLGVVHTSMLRQTPVFLTLQHKVTKLFERHMIHIFHSFHYNYCQDQQIALKSSLKMSKANRKKLSIYSIHLLLGLAMNPLIA